MHHAEATERHVAVTDWFHAQWLAVGIGILLLCAADALLTLTLIAHGATEINPLMDPLVQGSGHSFAYWKIGLTVDGCAGAHLAGPCSFMGQGGRNDPLRGSGGLCRPGGVTSYFFYVTSP